MSAAFWDDAIIAIFFFYGLAFYSLGLALLVESGRASELGFARSMRLLAGFGLLHGYHEWFDMFERGMELYYGRAFPLWLVWLRLAVLGGSFVALLAFGEHLLQRDGAATTWRITLGAIGVYALASVLVRLAYDLDDRAWAQATDVLARYILGVPGATLACWALWKQRSIFRKRGMGRFVQGLTLAALALALYGVVGQVFTGESVVFPSNVLNAALFRRVTGFPVQLFRAAMATLLAFSMIRVLRALEVENQQRLEAAKRAKLEAERRSREALARLNAELQAANEETARLLREVQRRDALRGELLQRITTAQENERKRIARELHDGPCQTLTGLALGLRGTASLVPPNCEAATQRLAELEAMATASLGELRHLINNLRPPQLDDMGLVAALRWQIENMSKRGVLHARMEVLGEPYPLPPEVETTLFRITQEALTNVVKHAQTDRAWVTLDFRNGPTLTVRDEGVGFDPSAVFQAGEPRMAWGLVGMQERAHLVNATLDLRSAPEEGTTLTVCLHLPKAEEADHADSRAHR